MTVDDPEARLFDASASRTTPEALCPPIVTAHRMDSTETFHVRIDHFVPDAPALDVLVDGHPVLTDVAFGDVNDYTEHRADTYAVSGRPAAGNGEVGGGETAGDGADGESEPDGGDPLVETDVPFEAGEYYTLLFVGTTDEPEVRLLTDGA